MLALDISYSMICRDVNLRNRLYKSKETLKKLIKQLRKHKIGLVVFAGKAFTLVPLTNDHNFLNNTISTVDTGMINIQGTNISECINRSISSFNFNNKLNKCIVIISDGGDHVTNEIDSMLKNTNKERVFIQTISIGSKKGGLIPVSNKEEPYIKDINDKYVTTRTNIKFLKDLAQKGNGIHINMETENIASLIKQINGIEGSNYKKPIILVKKTEIELKKEKDLYIYLLLIAFIIILSDLFLIRGSNDTKFQET